MSRIGNKPIPVPKGVEMKMDGTLVTVKGPKGELKQRFDPNMDISQENGEIVIKRPSDQRHYRAMHGLTRALLNNMVVGVSEGYEIRLEIQGTGYRAEMQGQELKLSLGFSHDVIVAPPPTLTFEVEGKNGEIIVIKSINKQLIGQVAADIRKLRPPEPYKGKGIRYQGEQIRRKAGKAGKVG